VPYLTMALILVFKNYSIKENRVLGGRSVSTGSDVVLELHAEVRSLVKMRKQTTAA